jgi:hypothetical protein
VIVSGKGAGDVALNHATELVGLVEKAHLLRSLRNALGRSPLGDVPNLGKCSPPGCTILGVRSSVPGTVDVPLSKKEFGEYFVAGENGSQRGYPAP